MTTASPPAGSGRRLALLVGSSNFEDAGLQRLRAPASDIAGLAEVLGDPDIGQFHVDRLLNGSSAEMTEQIEGFFADARRDDLLLLYYSGHGLKDDSGFLYFAARNTALTRLRSTSMSAASVNEMMESTRARRIVLILECCYGGAFTRGMRAKSAPAMDVVGKLSGRGRVILSASGATQYAFEGEDLVGSSAGDSSSLFTSAIIDGLRTGDADLNSDGLIDIDELYSFAYEVVKEATQHQTPVRASFEVEGSIVIARSVKTSQGRDSAQGAPSGGAQRVIPQEIPTGGHFLDVNTRAVSDLPSRVDRLGVGPVISGLAALLNDQATTLPLAIAVTAPWGGGKSSAMLQLKERLKQRRSADGGHRDWQFVDFPAWKYENTEHLWAALARTVYEQAQAEMTWRTKLYFRIRLERRRQGLWGFLLRGLWPPLAGVLLLIVAIGADVGKTTFGQRSGLGAVLVIVLSTSATVGRYWGVVSDPFKRAIDAHSKHYDYSERMGFTSQASNDIDSLCEVLLRSPDSALAVFVDDLDRCSSKNVVEVVEAVNQIFNSVEHRQCVFVLGMDWDIVVSSLDVAYADVVATLKERDCPLGRRFGSTFLSKIVQMTVALPPPDPPRLREYLASITGNAMPESESPGLPSEEEIASLESTLEDYKPKNPLDVYAAGQALLEQTPDPQRRSALQEAIRRAQARRFTTDSPDVARAEIEVLPYLERNPRQVKRFDNAFRLQLHVASSSPGGSHEFTLDQLVAMGKWVALRLRWRDLAAQLDRRPDLLSRMEAGVNTEYATDADVQALLLDEDLRILLEEPREQRRMASLPLDTILRVT